MKPWYSWGAVVLAVTLVGCSEPSPTGPEWIGEVGAMPPESLQDQAITVPTSARVGVPISIAVASIGSSNCTRPMGASVHVVQLTAYVAPLDLRYVDIRGVCVDDAVLHPRSTTVTFQQPGTATVVVMGVHPDMPGQVLEVRRQVQVEP